MGLWFWDGMRRGSGWRYGKVLWMMASWEGMRGGFFVTGRMGVRE